METKGVVIPVYARNVPPGRRVQIVCRGDCGVPRHAEVNRVDWFKAEDAEATGLYATCAKCGYQARDNHDWIRLRS